jgi:flavin-dependent dehydrogenase
MVRYDQPISYGIRRCEFDHYVLARSGARLSLGESLSTIERLENGWRINDSIEAKLLIGAGGHFCPVARWLGANPGKAEKAIVAQEIEFAMTDGQAASCSAEPGAAYIFFCDDLKGYGWYYRKGQYLNVGLGREDTSQLGESVSRFCDFLKSEGKIPADTPGKMLGHSYLLYEHSRRKLIADGVLLIGDATGVAYARSGEGIRPAIESGLIAAEVIRICCGHYSAADLQLYESRLAHRFGRRTKPAQISLLPFGARRLIAANLMKSNWFCRNMVVDRWFLNRGQPAYA